MRTTILLFFGLLSSAGGCGGSSGGTPGGTSPPVQTGPFQITAPTHTTKIVATSLIWVLAKLTDHESQEVTVWLDSGEPFPMAGWSRDEPEETESGLLEIAYQADLGVVEPGKHTLHARAITTDGQTFETQIPISVEPLRPYGEEWYGEPMVRDAETGEVVLEAGMGTLDVNYEQKGFRLFFTYDVYGKTDGWDLVDKAGARFKGTYTPGGFLRDDGTYQHPYVTYEGEIMGPENRRLLFEALVMQE